MLGFRRRAEAGIGRIPSSVVRFGPLLALLALLPTTTQAQTRAVVSSEIGVSNQGMLLSLGFSDGHQLSIRFEDGTVTIDGDEVGTFRRGDGLENSWRALLGRAVALEDEALAQAIREWAPPARLDAAQTAVAARIDGAIEAALTPPDPDPLEDATGTSVGSDGALSFEMLNSLLGRTDRFLALAEALEEVDGLELADLSSGDLQFHVDEHVTVAAGEVLDASLILIDSELDVQGHLTGNAILVGGVLTVGEQALIDGRVHLADARISRDGGSVAGGVNRIRLEREVVDRDDLSQLRDEIREEVRRELRRSGSDEDAGRSSSVRNAFRHMVRGVSGMMENLMTFALIAVLAFGVVRFFGSNLEVVAEAARQNPMRAGLVGVAGTFLLLPVWVLGIVGLCISLIGIPVLLAWIPLLPLAAVLAMGLGYLAVASNVGDWVSRQRLQGFDWVRRSNTLSVILAGVAALILPFFAANFILLAGDWLDFVRGLLQFVGTAFAVVALAVGFGAVLLTRGGRHRPWAYDAEDLDFDDSSWDEDLGGGPSTTVDLDAKPASAARVTDEPAEPPPPAGATPSPDPVDGAEPDPDDV